MPPGVVPSYSADMPPLASTAIAINRCFSEPTLFVSPRSLQALLLVLRDAEGPPEGG